MTNFFDPTREEAQAIHDACHPPAQVGYTAPPAGAPDGAFSNLNVNLLQVGRVVVSDMVVFRHPETKVVAAQRIDKTGFGLFTVQDQTPQPAPRPGDPPSPKPETLTLRCMPEGTAVSFGTHGAVVVFTPKDGPARAVLQLLKSDGTKLEKTFEEIAAAFSGTAPLPPGPPIGI